MRACAELAVRERDGRTVVTTLRAQAPLALVPRRGVAGAARPEAVVHLVGSASTPLAGDDVELTVAVGPGAHLVLTGVAAAIALPGAGPPGSTVSGCTLSSRTVSSRTVSSRTVLRCTVADGGSLTHRPEPTVVTARADHETVLDVTLAPTASLHARDVLVAGRTAERAGRYRGTVRITEDGLPLLVQTQELGDPLLDSAPAHLGGHRVLGTEVLVGPGREPVAAASGPGWSLSPLAVRGALATAVGHDAVTAARRLAEAVAAAAPVALR